MDRATENQFSLSRSQRAWLGVSLVLGLLLFSAHAVTKIPHSDEGDLASAALMLLDEGRIAFPMSHMYGPSAREQYFAVPPFYPSVLAGWFAGAGRSLESYRLFHVMWFALLIGAWTRLCGAATVRSVSIPVAGALLALNYDLINLSISRYDIVCASLNAAAMAAYVSLRRDHFSRAILVANAFLAMSALTHPYALFGLVACLAMVVAHGDWRRLRVRHVLTALAPYAIGAGMWALVIEGHWSEFLEQMSYGARSKQVDLGRPWAVFAEDAVIRWWELFAGWRDNVPPYMRAKTAFIVVWVLAPFAVLSRATPATRGLRVSLLVYSLATLVIVPFTDTLHLQIYNIHAIVGLVALTAIAVSDFWERSPRLAPALVILVAGMCAFGVVGIALRVSARELQREYKPVVKAVRPMLAPRAVVLAPGEIGFGLDFQAHVRIDPSLSSLASGAMPEVIVESRELGLGRTPTRSACAPGVVVQDTTHYSVEPLGTPREYYRVLVREDLMMAAVDRPMALRIVRECGTDSVRGP